jgi:RHS repeat-associated protein
VSRSAFVLALVLGLLVLSQVLSNWSLLIQPTAYAAGPGVRPAAPSTMTFQQFLKAGQRSKAYHGPLIAPSARPSSKSNKGQPTNYTNLPPSTEPATMKPILQTLSPAFLSGSPGTSALHLVGSDGRLEVLIPAGALDVSHATLTGGGKPGGTLRLELAQVHGHYVSQMSVLGSYEFQVLDGTGQVVNGVTLHSSITIIYHYQQSEMDALDIDPAHVYLSWPSLIAAAQQAHQPTTGLILPMQNDSATHTLTTQSSVLGPHPFDMMGEPQNQSPPALHLASVQGNSGQLAYSYPLRVTPGSGGFAPQLMLNYSSSGPNQRTSRTSPAGDAGDGFSLSLGSISEETYAPSNTQWYFINDVANVGDRLIPTGSNNLFETQHISYLKILQINPGSNNTCFHVWDKSGTYYELGCTADSLEYWTDGNGVQHDYRWNVDKIIAPNEGPKATTYRLMKLYYYQDKTSFQIGSTTYHTVRDSNLEQIIYGSGDTNTVSSVAGTVDFFYHGPSGYSAVSKDSSVKQTWVTAYGNNANYNCSSTPPVNTSMRCDDPVTDGSVPPPAVMSTLTLDTVVSYLGSDGGNPAYNYAFSYSGGTFKDTPFSACSDPYTLVAEYCAGEHLLMSVTPSIYQGSTATAQPGVTFGYSSPLENTYYDSLPNHVEKGTNIQYNAQTYWQYMNFYEDYQSGVGGKITWSIAYNNTHGTPNDTDSHGNLDDRYDPLHCVIWNDCTGNYAHPDDNAWSEYIVTATTALGKDSSASTLAPAVTTYNYRLAKTGTYSGSGTWCYPAGSDSDCVGDNWLPSGDGDWQDFDHQEYEGFAQVLITSPAGDLTVQDYYSTAGWNTVWSYSNGFPAGINFLGGSMYEEDFYSGNAAVSGALLQSVTSIYATGTNACRSATATYTACETVLESTTDTESELTGTGFPPSVSDSYTYDDYTSSGGLAAFGSKVYHNLTQEQIGGSNLSAIYPVTENWTYTTTDTTTSNPAWTYYTVDTVTHSETDDASGHIWLCLDTTYDEGTGNSTPDAGWPTTVTSHSDCTHQSTSAITTYQDYDAYGHMVASIDGVAAALSSLYNSQGCSVTSGTIVASSSAWPKSTYTSCAAYSNTTIFALPDSTTNAFGQTTNYGYDNTQGNVLTSMKDPNSQTTSYAYSYTTGTATTQVSEPGETNGYTTQSTSNSSCTNTSSLPCFEIDSNSSLYNTVHTSTFYDQLAREVETRTPGPGSSYDTVVITTYNDQNHTKWQSVPFLVAHGSGWIDPNNVTDYQGKTPGGTLTFYDALGRAIATQDPLIGTGSDGITCSATLTGSYTACVNYSLGSVQGDNNKYLTVTSVDPNKHVAAAYVDTLGHTVYTQRDNGLYGGTLTLVEQTATVYNALDKPTTITVTDELPQSGQSVTSVQTTAQYDDLGRLTQLVDPDRGTHNYTYDANGNLIQDSSGSRTIGYAYDLLNRVGCVQDEPSQESTNGACGTSANGGSYNPYIQNTYDTNKLTLSGTTDYPIGELTQSVSTTYFSGSAASVTEAYEHDARGRSIGESLQFSLPSSWNVTTALPTYQEQLSYNDADQLTTTTTSTVPTGQGFTTTLAYDSTGALYGLSNNTSSTPNLATLAFNSRDQLDTINFQTNSGGALAAEQFVYDANLRTVSATGTWGANSGQNGTIYSEGLSYDAASNLVSLSQTQNAVGSSAGGSETSNFCYNEQNELVWAGNSGTQPGAGTGTCGSGTLSSGLSGASYSNSYVYTHLGELWQGPLSGGNTQVQYLYCASNTHQLIGLYPTSSGATCSNYTGKTASYNSSYDAFGNVTSRTANSTTATLTYDILDHLTQWYANSTNQEQYLYDASGERMLRRFTNGNGTTILTYPFGIEEHQYSGTGSNQWNIYYYYLAGRSLGSLGGNGTQFYLTDRLGSIVSAFNNAQGGANMKSNQLFGPYGNVRYYACCLNTAKGFIGQYNDGTGLDYFNARYYDPVVGVFLAADTVEGNAQGMNPYAYANGNPETYNDPTGHASNPPDLQKIYFDTLVETWYAEIETDEGFQVRLPNLERVAARTRIPPDNRFFQIPNAKLPELDNISQLDQWITDLQRMASQGGSSSYGLPDIVNMTQHIFYDVKGSNTAGEFSADTTIEKGGWQVWWYATLASRYNVEGINDWHYARTEEELKDDDPLLFGTLQVCGGACDIPIPGTDGYLQVKFAGNGILTYRVEFPDLLPVPVLEARLLDQVQKWGSVALAIVSAIGIAVGSGGGGGGAYDGGGFPGAAGAGAGGCSFRFDTYIWTPIGKTAIGQLVVGDQVWTFNSFSDRMELQPILHVWRHVDHDLVHLTLISLVGNQWTEEFIDTTSRHPFLTQEEGFVPAGQLQVGMRVMSADGSVGIVMDINAITGSMTMYNLEVAVDHTFLVGNGQWVVHNDCTPFGHVM